MENMKILGIVIAAAVSIIVLGSVLMPVFDDVTRNEDTFTNEGYYYMEHITAADTTTRTLAYTYSPDTQTLTYTFNGSVINTSGWPASVTLATDADAWVVRAGTSEWIGLQVIGPNFNSGGHNTRSTTITFSGGVATSVVNVWNESTQTEDVSTRTSTYEDLWIYSPTATDYVMKKTNETAYINNDSQFLAVGVTELGVWNTVIKITGTIDSYTPVIMYPPETPTTVTNKAVVAEAVNGYDNLYQLDKLTFTISDSTTSADAIYSYFIVPAEVDGHIEKTLTSGQISILKAIPVMIIIGVLMMVLGVVRTKEI